MGYQLHLQFIHMPMTPFQYCQAKKNVTEDTNIEDIMNKAHDHGVVYDSKHREFLQKCWSLQDRFGAWEENDFECQVVNGKVYNIADGRMEPESDPKDIQAKDTKKLQNYGRPYTETGQTTGTYYKYA